MVPLCAAVSLTAFLALAPSTLAGPWKPWCRYPSLTDANADQLQCGLQRGCFSSLDLVNAYIQRIAEVNSTLHVVAELNPDARATAKILDQERKKGKARGPLHGLPILLKGNIGVTGKMHTTAGSYALLGAELAEEATVVTKLKDAGAIILGMAGLSEWANFRSSNSTNGWSAYGGQVFAAYYPQQDPCGSSSGSGVGSDLGLAFGAIGTETSGSIVCPSEHNNIVGIKPTVGLTSRYMVIPVSEHADSIGPMTRTVKDAALLLQVIAGRDIRDNYTSAIPFDGIPDYTAACKLSGLEGKRIGIPRNVLELASSSDSSSGPLLATFDDAISLLRKFGATIIDNANYTALEEFVSSPAPLGVLFADFHSNLASFLSTLKTNPHNIHNIADLRTFTHSSPAEDYPARDTIIWDGVLAAGMSNTSPEFWELYQQALHFGDEGGVLGALRRHELDAVVLPSSYAYEIPALIGAPVVSVPMGAWPSDTEVEYDANRRELVTRAPGFPMGLSFIGGLWSEEKLLGIAYAFEQRSKARGKLKRWIVPKTDLRDVAGQTKKQKAFAWNVV
ncbi:hypothetical protein VTO42DRAFT_2352 [Malbranchea cinnamomea]